MQERQTNRLLEEAFLVEGGYKIYPKSVTEHEKTQFVMVKKDAKKYLYVTGSGSLFDALEGEIVSSGAKLAPANHANRLVLNTYFDWTNPRAFGNKVTTMGVGDRLGLASPGHIAVMRNYQVKPILAQQSIRELTLMERSIYDVLDAAAYAAVQEGYTGGFGADGDHLKLEDDI
uniref:tagaturonate epimerase family protein n=1 Tax=Jeotgalibaca arthritidis TaxID=1868794 RepID=UPI0035A0BDFE